MHASLQKLNLVKNKVNEIIDRKQLKTNPQIIVVTKTFPLSVITPLIETGHRHFGENKIQEAIGGMLDAMQTELHAAEEEQVDDYEEDE